MKSKTLKVREEQGLSRRRSGPGQTGGRGTIKARYLFPLCLLFLTLAACATYGDYGYGQYYPYEGYYPYGYSSPYYPYSYYPYGRYYYPYGYRERR